MNSFISSMQRDLDASFSPITVFRLAIPPDDAVSRCVGIREQFKQRGWSGTELIIGHSGRALLTDFLFNTRGLTLLFSQAISRLPNRVKRAAITKIYVDIIARTIETESGPMTELWCLADWATRINLSGTVTSNRRCARSKSHSTRRASCPPPSVTSIAGTSSRTAPSRSPHSCRCVRQQRNANGSRPSSAGHRAGTHASSPRRLHRG